MAILGISFNFKTKPSSDKSLLSGVELLGLPSSMQAKFRTFSADELSAAKDVSVQDVKIAKNLALMNSGAFYQDGKRL
ncbi:MAG: hypothetical protein K9G62_05620 [Alphaproteobacteria bacterium]|nr:hypothetical protein [Alphaproteobacteria bacterium]